MKFSPTAITMGISFALLMSIVFYQSLSISGIAIGIMFGLSMTMAFAEDEKEDEDDNEHSDKTK